MKHLIENGGKYLSRKVRGYLHPETVAIDEVVAPARICDCTLGDLKVLQQNFGRVNSDADGRACPAIRKLVNFERFQR